MHQKGKLLEFRQFKIKKIFSESAIKKLNQLGSIVDNLYSKILPRRCSLSQQYVDSLCLEFESGNQPLPPKRLRQLKSISQRHISKLQFKQRMPKVGRPDTDQVEALNYCKEHFVAFSGRKSGRQTLRLKSSQVGA